VLSSLAAPGTQTIRGLLSTRLPLSCEVRQKSECEDDTLDVHESIKYSSKTSAGMTCSAGCEASTPGGDATAVWRNRDPSSALVVDHSDSPQSFQPHIEPWTTAWSEHHARQFTRNKSRQLPYRTDYHLSKHTN
jgi:hypothetical protein